MTKGVILSNFGSIGTVQTHHLFLFPASSLHFKTNPQAITQCQNMKVQTRVSCGLLSRVGVWCLLAVLRRYHFHRLAAGLRSLTCVNKHSSALNS